MKDFGKAAIQSLFGEHPFVTTKSLANANWCSPDEDNA